MMEAPTDSQYWIQWQVFLCAEWILLALVIASVMILKHDVPNNSIQKADASRYADELWKPCLREIHPAILLLYRVVAFCLMVAVLVADIILEGSDMFYYYTQWTFTLLTIYFGLGSLFSMYGCCISRKKLASDNPRFLKIDDEVGNSSSFAKERNENVTRTKNREAAHWGYIFEIVFQTSAGAVVLTDCVFWLIIFPFLAEEEYNLNFLMVTMHSVNVVLLLIDTWLNCMWILHACTSSGWPYPFLDLSSRWAPVLVRRSDAYSMLRSICFNGKG
ncbi:unnamed protein product [Victoria cruziana]